MTGTHPTYLTEIAIKGVVALFLLQFLPVVSGLLDLPLHHKFITFPRKSSRCLIINIV